MTRAEALERLRARLEAAGIESADQEAVWLLAHVLRMPPGSLRASRNEPLAPEHEDTLEAMATRRERHEPLQLILGDVPFHGVTLQVEPGVFIPRPETEELVEAVLETLSAARPPLSLRAPGPGHRLLDLGTGTGAIAVALLRALPDWTGVAVDRSPVAVALAARNGHRNGVGERLRAVVGDFASPAPAAWLEDRPFDLVASNPPYIPRDVIPTLMPEVRDHDPLEALDGGPDGLDAFRQLAARLPLWLRPGGLVALEIGADQADTVVGILSPHIRDARVLSDRAGLPRIVIGIQRSGDA